MNHDASPTPLSGRIGSLDFLRGIAVLGILLINIESFSYPDPWSPFKFGYANAGDHHTRFIVYLLAQGKFFGMFTLLFGAGFYIFLERLEQRGSGSTAFDLYSRRLIWLFIFGLVHAYLIWDGDILYHYAACGFFLFPFRSVSKKWLIVILFLLAGIVAYNALESTHSLRAQHESYLRASETSVTGRTDEDNEAIANWEQRIAPGKPDLNGPEPYRMTVAESIRDNASHQRVHKGAIFYQGIFFRTMIMMILGILLYRQGVFTDFRKLRFYWPATFLITGLALIQNYLRYYHWTYKYYEPVLSYPRSLLFAFPKETLALAYILLFNGIYQVFLQRYQGNPVSLAGRMALTNYILQSLICAILFYGFGFGLFNTFSRTELLMPVLAIWTFQLLFSSWWLRRFRQGPLEALWRNLTYRK